MKEIYDYVYSFCKEDSNNSKVMDLGLAINLLQLLLPNGIHTSNFIDFLRNQKTYKVLNEDQWKMFYQFNESVNKDLTQYDENSACKYRTSYKSYK